MRKNLSVPVLFASMLVPIVGGCAVELSATRERGEIRVAVKPLEVPADRTKVAGLSAQEIHQ